MSAHRYWGLKIIGNQFPTEEWGPEIIQILFKNRADAVISVGGTGSCSAPLEEYPNTGASQETKAQRVFQTTPATDWVWTTTKPTELAPVLYSYDFGTAVEVERYMIRVSNHPQARPSLMELVYSDDGITWTVKQRQQNIQYLPAVNGVEQAPTWYINYIPSEYRTDWAELSLAWAAMLRTKTGAVYGWGDDRGNFGNAHFGQTKLNYPEVLNVGTAKALAAEVESLTSFVVLENGSMWVSGGNWSTSNTTGTGINTFGNTGLGDTLPRNVFTQTGNGTSDWQKVVCFQGGTGVTFALKTNGTLWATGKVQSAASPNSLFSVQQTVFTQVGTDTWLDIACGAGALAGIKTNGTLWLYGYGAGYLGLGLAGNVPTLTQVGNSGNWTTLPNMFYDDFFVINSAGELWCAGVNSYGGGTLGLGPTRDAQPTLTRVGSETGWRTVTNWYGFSFATKGGQLYGTGDPWAGSHMNQIQADYFRDVFTPVPGTIGMNVAEAVCLHGDTDCVIFRTEVRNYSGTVPVGIVLTEPTTVTGEGVWSVSGTTLTFTGEQGFFGNPTPIGYTLGEVTGTITVTFE
jgi:alpha-tubulin suppressor-like RCC1 family protein